MKTVKYGYWEGTREILYYVSRAKHVVLNIPIVLSVFLSVLHKTDSNKHACTAYRSSVRKYCLQHTASETAAKAPRGDISIAMTECNATTKSSLTVSVSLRSQINDYTLIRQKLRSISLLAC